MKNIIILLAMFCSVAVQAREKHFGDWIVVKADNGDMVAATVEDNGEKALVYRCFEGLGQCAHVLVADIECETDDEYPVLVNAEHAALSMDTVCSDDSELVLTEFDQIHEILINSDVAGFAIPMASGQFKVVRFSLKGSERAMNAAEGGLRDSADYL